MPHLHARAPSPAHSLSPLPKTLAEQIECDRALLRQHAIDSLSEALHVVNSDPKSVIELQQAIGQSIRGVTALKCLAALGCSTAPTQHIAESVAPHSPPQVDEAPAVQATALTRKRRRRRYFDTHYKRQVIQLMREQHLSVGQVCKHLNLVDSVVRRWILEFGAQETAGLHSLCGTESTGSPAAHQQSDAEQRVRQLEDRLRQLQADNELLKKAAASFAREIHGLCAAPEGHNAPFAIARRHPPCGA